MERFRTTETSLDSRNGNAEVDYLQAINGKVVPIEVKASTQGSMQSLWLFMRKHKLHDAVRTSLENFAQLEYFDKDALSDDSTPMRHVKIIPLYALSNIPI